MKLVEAHDVKNKVMKYARYERDHIAVVTEGLNNADVLGITRHRRAVEFEIKVSRSDLQKELAAIEYARLTMVEGKVLAPAEPETEQMELNIKLGQLKNKSGGWSKISKHEEYIAPEKYAEKHHKYYFANHSYMEQQYLPNQFYLVVPDKLVQLAIDGTKGTGYGVIAYDGCRGGHYGYKVGDNWYDDLPYENRPDGTRWISGMPCELSGKCFQEITVKQKARKIHDTPVADRIMTSMLGRACTENITLMDEVKRLSEQVKELTAAQSAKEGE